MTANQAERSPTDGTSFEVLYSTHHRAVLAYCARRASRSNAWDAASETFLVAWRKINEVPPGEQALPWLFGVAYKVLSNQRRGAGRQNRLRVKLGGQGSNVSPLNPELQIVRNEEELEVVAALGRLRQIDREVIMLALWEEMPPVDIATVLGISRLAVDKRFQRAKERLAAELRPFTATQDRATHEPIEEGGVA